MIREPSHSEESSKLAIQASGQLADRRQVPYQFRRQVAIAPEFSHEMPPAAIDGYVAHILSETSWLAGHLVRGSIPPGRIIDVLNEGRVPFMLMGAHAVAGWTNQARATLDVDVLVPMRRHAGAVGLLSREFPKLEVLSSQVVTRFRNPLTGRIVLDVMKPNQPIFTDAFRYVQLVRARKRSYRVPSLELMLAFKFAAMVSPFRDGVKKKFDAADFITIVNVNDSINLERLNSLGDRVYPAGGIELVQLVTRIRNGETIVI